MSKKKGNFPGFEETYVVSRMPTNIGDLHRQNGEGTVTPEGVIVAPKKGDWIWWILSVALIGFAVYIAFQPHLLSRIFG